MIAVNIINQSHHALPKYQTAGSAGMDLCAFIPETITLQPLERTLVPTGLFIELPLGSKHRSDLEAACPLKKALL